MLKQFDLNLLIIFDALYTHRSVSKAAEVLFISQSACSHALNRLRDSLEDPLFVRVNNQMEPTKRAIRLATYVHQALPLITKGLSQHQTFDPKTSSYQFKLMATDYTQYSLLPELAQLFTTFPKVTLTILPSTQASVEQQLSQENLDFVLGFEHSNFTSSSVAHHTWFSDDYCTIVRQNHPQINGSINLKQFLSAQHIRIAPWGEAEGIVDKVLAKQQCSRHVAIHLPSLLAAPHIVATSDMILTLPRFVAINFSNTLNYQILTPPIELPKYHLNLYWHRTQHGNGAIEWFINLVKSFKS
ncbi:LysR family transcriptional regulator [Thalassotalea marina]|uniref:Transcriptional regulator n=1 Tax=Thalassotalea marina TaxID=1673741 RepID=A0A919BC58_9GAMM|nr:LysR family transcriptional regulator [Thalassotalea marina]GHF81619.1 transcriptional regulator [Thalassotalea marina]